MSIVAPPIGPGLEQRQVAPIAQDRVVCQERRVLDARVVHAKSGSKSL